MTPRCPVPPVPKGLDRDGTLDLLRGGELDVLGRMPSASNGTFLATLEGDRVTLPAIYKPRRGERPLWDFPDGTLCRRETAAFVVSEALGWGIVPETVLRDGPLGPGMVQRFVDHDPDEHYFTLLDTNRSRLRAVAIFDVVINNADRKGGHCLRSRRDGVVYGIDHGLAFHPTWKLRTVIWDFASEHLGGADRNALDVLAARCDDDLGDELASLLAPVECRALTLRVRALLASGLLPEPGDGYRSVPWPAV